MQAYVKKMQVPILMYHSISHDATAHFKPFTVSPGLFADQMAYLYQEGYTPITVTQFVVMRTQSAAALPERPIVLTFDDGFADFYHEALPVLQRYGFQATLYVATAFISSTSRWLEREGETQRQMLTWQQLREISAQGIECGAHSHRHLQLDVLPLPAIKDEIMQSKELLEQNLSSQVMSFAYPFGYSTATVRRLVRERGYTSACAVKHAMSSEATDSFALSRLMVRVGTDSTAFAALLGGRSSKTVAGLYARARTPIWQVVRRSSALARRPRQGSSHV